MIITLNGFTSGQISIDGKELTPNKSLEVRDHSPDGFNWGYGGSGPAQLALAILLEYTDEETALANYQTFKRDVIAEIKERDFTKEIDLQPYLEKY